jgi:hypothetical protein
LPQSASNTAQSTALALVEHSAPAETAVQTEPAEQLQQLEHAVSDVAANVALTQSVAVTVGSFADTELVLSAADSSVSTVTEAGTSVANTEQPNTEVSH